MKYVRVVLAGLALLAAAAWYYHSPSLQPGDTAPDFDLPGSDGKRYTLSQLRGQTVVLAWFPKAHTGYCTRECLALRNSATALNGKVALFAVSCDAPEVNQKFAQQLNLPYPILSASSDIARAYGVLKGLPLPARHTIYISSEGKILRIDKAIRVETAGEDILKNLESLGVKP